MNNILFLVAHPALERSRANRAVVQCVRDIPGVTLHILYDQYPHFHIDVDREQELLSAHQVIVIQHPLYWYTVPALLKMWLDDVLRVGWAYGEGGEELKGKLFQLSLTVGGVESKYDMWGESNLFTLPQLLAPWRQTAHLCQMVWQEPLTLFDANRATKEDLLAHAEIVRKRLQQMQSEVAGG